MTENHPRLRLIPPERRGGFENWYGFEYSNRPFDTWVNVDRNGATERIQLEGYQTDGLTDLLVNWIKDHQAATQGEQPFFATLSVEPPHSPYTAPEEDQSRHIPAHIDLRSNVPPVDHRGTESRTSAFRSAGERCFANHVDIAPTTLGICGITMPKWMEGYDYSWCVQGGKPDHPPPDSAYISLPVAIQYQHTVDRSFRGIVTREGWKWLIWPIICDIKISEKNCRIAWHNGLMIRKTTLFCQKFN